MRYPQGGQGRNVREVLPTKSPYIAIFNNTAESTLTLEKK